MHNNGATYFLGGVLFRHPPDVRRSSLLLCGAVRLPGHTLRDHSREVKQASTNDISRMVRNANDATQSSQKWRVHRERMPTASHWCQESVRSAILQTALSECRNRQHLRLRFDSIAA